MKLREMIRRIISEETEDRKKYAGLQFLSKSELLQLKNFKSVENSKIKITPTENSYKTRFGFVVDFLDENGVFEGGFGIQGFSKSDAIKRLFNRFKGIE